MTPFTTLSLSSTLATTPLYVYIYIYIFFFFFHHTMCESMCDTLASSAANQGDNTVSVAQGGTATPGATEEWQPGWRLMRLGYRTYFHTLYDEKKKNIYIYIYTGVYIYLLWACLKGKKKWYSLSPPHLINKFITAYYSWRDFILVQSKYYS